jgi:hypothetical protein
VRIINTGTHDSRIEINDEQRIRTTSCTFPIFLFRIKSIVFTYRLFIYLYFFVLISVLVPYHHKINNMLRSNQILFVAYETFMVQTDRLLDAENLMDENFLLFENRYKPRNPATAILNIAIFRAGWAKHRPMLRYFSAARPTLLIS